MGRKFTSMSIKIKRSSHLIIRLDFSKYRNPRRDFKHPFKPSKRPSAKFDAYGEIDIDRLANKVLRIEPIHR